MTAPGKPTVLDLTEQVEQCGACRFFRATQQAQTVGHCYRYPQAVRKDATSFCGEYQPIEGKR